MDQQLLENIGYVAKYTLPIVAGLILKLGRTFVEKGPKQKSKALAELEFISGFLAFDIKRRERLVVEHAFAAHFKHRFSFEELVALLKFKNPSKGFSLLKTCRSVINILPDGTFEFRDKFKTSKARTRRKWVNFGLYFVLIYIALLPVLFANVFVASMGLQAVIPLALWPLFLGASAVEVLKNGVTLGCGELLILEQQKAVA